jgi:hypothetical protein
MPFTSTSPMTRSKPPLRNPYIGPIALALVSRAAPAAVNAMMVGSYHLAIFLGGIFSGWLGRFYEVISPVEFWLMHSEAEHILNSCRPAKPC